jgi:hypothetical protein
VETDGGFVEDVDDASEPGSELAGETDALELTAGQCAGRSGEGDVADAEPREAPDSGVDLLQERAGDLLL